MTKIANGATYYMNLYNKNLIDHYHNPRNYKKLEEFDWESTVLNPLCGDKINLQVKLEGNVILKVGYQGEGCIISLATASILFEKITNQTTESCTLFTKEDILNLINLDLGPNRLKCALISLEALKDILENIKIKSKSSK